MLDKDQFLKENNLFAEFHKSGLDWAVLDSIAQQHENNRKEYYKRIALDHVDTIMKFKHVHSVRYRVKETESLIEKIIRKTNEGEPNINVDTYRTKITDLIGIRILYVFKSDYYPIHEQIVKVYEKKFVERRPQINLRTGDDRNLYNKIRDPIINENKVYRSIHYTMLAHENDSDSPRIEIQTRTIFEEGWSEINHKLVYKKGNSAGNLLLQKTSDILNALSGDCDTLGELMLKIYSELCQDNKNQGASPENDLQSDAIQGIMKEIIKM